jgi:hypothetical protein
MAEPVSKKKRSKISITLVPKPSPTLSEVLEWHHEASFKLGFAQFTLLMPKNPKISGFLDVVQEEGIRWSQEYRLYPPPFEKVLIYGRFAGLAALSNSALEQNELQIMTDYMSTLVAMDDHVENVSDLSKFDALIRRTHETFQFLPFPEGYLGSAVDKGYKNIADRIRDVLINKYDTPVEELVAKSHYFCYNLCQVISSTKSEAYLRNTKERLSILKTICIYVTLRSVPRAATH